MRGQPRVITIDGATILRALLFPNSDEETLLHLAACEKIELHASTQDWNFILRGLIEISRRASENPISGPELRQLRIAIPVNFT